MHVLELGPELRWLRLDGGERVDLGARPVLQRLAKALIDDREAHGQGLDVEALLGKVWPGERFVGNSGNSRLYTAIRALRKLVFGDLLEKGLDGYRLAESVHVATEPVAKPRVAAATSSLVGREGEIGQLTRAFDGGARLVTLVGPGGVGKSRLAREYAVRVRALLDGGAFFCELADCGSEAELCAAVAGTVGLDARRGLAELAAGLAERGSMLLVLDNLEQLAPEVVEGLIAQLPEARVLGTSRAVLRLPGEQVVTLDPLDAEEGRQLFLDRARRAGAEVPDDAAVAAVVEALDGFPLAIELAASRARLLDPSEMVRLLDQGREVARSRRGQRPSRHRSMKDTLAWSWSLLPDWGQEALARLTVFRGGFTLGAAEVVLDDGEADPLEALEELLDRSLLHRAPGSSRYSLFRHVRDFAQQHLAADDPAIARHGAYFGGLGRSYAHPLSGTTTLPDEALRHELPNLVQAARHAMAVRDVDTTLRTGVTAAAIYRRWGPRHAGLDLLAELLACSWLPMDSQLYVHRWRTRLGTDLGLRSLVASEAAVATEKALQVGDERWIALFEVLFAWSGSLPPTEALAVSESAVARLDRVGGTEDRGSAQWITGWLALAEGHPERAAAYIARSASLFAEGGHDLSTPGTSLAMVAQAIARLDPDLVEDGSVNLGISLLRDRAEASGDRLDAERERFHAALIRELAPLRRAMEASAEQALALGQPQRAGVVLRELAALKDADDGVVLAGRAVALLEGEELNHARIVLAESLLALGRFEHASQAMAQVGEIREAGWKRRFQLVASVLDRSSRS